MFAQATAPAGQADEAVVVAAIDHAALAGAAGIVVDGGLDADAVAGLEVRDGGADGFDDAAEFVAEG